mmetsp:Transcript_18163/g.39257  ORF Transcript_18163/g.39257 Transcript_18163/m.39257 type:complete len:190 (+) Transcript_18163:192-761(+)
MHQTVILLTRRSANCCRGKYSSMMDMGGVAQIGVDTRINVGKNNKVMAVALDFHLITRSIEERRQRALAEEEKASGGGNKLQNATSAGSTASVQPDTSLIQKMANLLNVNLGGVFNTQPEKDDLSSMLGSSDTNEKSSADAKKKHIKNSVLSTHGHQVQIRRKATQQNRNWRRWHRFSQVREGRYTNTW